MNLENLLKLSNVNDIQFKEVNNIDIFCPCCNKKLTSVEKTNKRFKYINHINNYLWRDGDTLELSKPYLKDSQSGLMEGRCPHCEGLYYTIKSTILSCPIEEQGDYLMADNDFIEIEDASSLYEVSYQNTVIGYIFHKENASINREYLLNFSNDGPEIIRNVSLFWSAPFGESDDDYKLSGECGMTNGHFCDSWVEDCWNNAERFMENIYEEWFLYKYNVQKNPWGGDCPYCSGEKNYPVENQQLYLNYDDKEGVCHDFVLEHYKFHRYVNFTFEANKDTWVAHGDFEPPLISDFSFNTYMRFCPMCGQRLIT